ncbi:Alpha/Beta hydrolase protein [Aspergillus pseudodeflectus]|uniref:Alpha/Beta hydrolase protein n=1 Tax=Aspergillus pseudodeflectus TaxID=176178 RepID=A0ABR4KH73_9EURO
MLTVFSIVAVHGLGGDAFTTWTASNGKLWLRDFLPQQIPNARIMTFGYDSSWFLSKSIMGIPDFASDLLFRLKSHRRTLAQQSRPIIFVCHSLGGIIVKKAIIVAHERSETYGTLLSEIKGVVFLGTPHRGSYVATWGQILANIPNTLTLGNAIKKEFMTTLTAHSRELQDISHSFVERGRSLRLFSFYEAEKFPGLTNEVVPKDSAILALPNEDSTFIQADHKTMVKFDSLLSQKYDPVWRLLQEWVSLIVGQEPGLLTSQGFSPIDLHLPRPHKYEVSPVHCDSCNIPHFGECPFARSKPKFKFRRSSL